jgi:acetyl esterase/lipase
MFEIWNFRTPWGFAMHRTLLLLLLTSTAVAAEEPRRIDVWNGPPPGETQLSTGETLPRRPNEDPPATRIGKITQPQLEVYEPAADKRTGVGVIILPGGGYNYVVQDKEGSEAARWLNDLGATGFVLRYRTKTDETKDAPWKRPVQDAQRAISLLRARAVDWKLDPHQIGIMGFSAGGQAAAIAVTGFDRRAYAAADDVDQQSCRPDFAMLIYPWNLWDAKTGNLMSEIQITANTPPTLLVHTHDDNSSSLGSVYFYAALKQHKVPAELHVYEAGGHGYGLRPVAGTTIHTWPIPAEAWFVRTTMKRSR